MRPQVSDATGWDTLDPQDRLQLLVESLGRERLEVELAALVPSAEVLRAQVTDFHKTLLGLPCPIIVTSTWDGLVEATLDELDAPYHVIADDEAIEPVLALQDGSRVVIKILGDPLAGDPLVLTRDDHRAYAERRPADAGAAAHLAAERTLLLYGHGLRRSRVRPLLPRRSCLPFSLPSGGRATSRHHERAQPAPGAVLGAPPHRGRLGQYLVRAGALDREPAARSRASPPVAGTPGDAADGRLPRAPDRRRGRRLGGAEHRRCGAWRRWSPSAGCTPRPAQLEDWTDERDERAGLVPGAAGAGSPTGVPCPRRSSPTPRNCC